MIEMYAQVCTEEVAERACVIDLDNRVGLSELCCWKGCSINDMMSYCCTMPERNNVEKVDDSQPIFHFKQRIEDELKERRKQMDMLDLFKHIREDFRGLM
ncbi:unnamed protein product [Caenorhabditis bovis]|uniref:Insulin-like domain-containing protein n=1 Tax=Caenorhabditis bovis TaxID=2654633 RepID=A0A8S1FBR9_9PELO|nr:unnamed protein product [Caenorhabditis bovis]